MTTDIIIKHHQLSLRIVGAWPKSSLTPIFYLTIGMTFFYLVFEIWDIIEVYNNLELLMDNLVVTIGVIIGLCKIAVFRLKRRKIIGLVNTISHDYNLESELSQVMSKNCACFQFVAKFLIVLDNTMNLTYCIKTLISYIFDKVSDRKFFAPSKFPFDARQSPLYEVLNMGQIILGFIHFNANALVDGFFVTLVLHACTKVDMVKREINNYSTACENFRDNNKITRKALQKLHQKHLESIEFSKNTQDVFSLVVFFHITFITLMQVMSGFMFIDGLESGAQSFNLIHYFVLTTSFLTTAGYYCICGEYLKYQNETIVDELCDCAWYTFSKQNQETMKLMLTKAQKPVAVTMGKFNDLSLIFLTSIVKTSFSFLSLVRAVR